MKSVEIISEICGIHAGDGYLRNDGRRIEMDISGSVEEKPYYENHVIPLFSKIFNIKIEGRVFHHRNTYGFVIRKKKIIERVHNLGFPYGKKTLSIKVPKFILKTKNLKLKCMFLRGVFDTDGCITFDKRYSKDYILFKRKYHTYPRIILTTVSRNFFLDLQKLLKSLNIVFWTQIYTPRTPNYNKSFRIWVRGNSAKEWMRIVGSENPIKLSRFLLWKKYGFCPPNTSYEDRVKMLNGEIDPRSFYGPVA